MLEIRLLGRFEVRRDGELVPIQSRAGQSLLAYLLLRPGVSHRREQLAGLIAPDAGDESARGALRHALWRLRKSLGADPRTGRDYFLADDISIGLDPAAAYALDVTAFTAPAATAEELIAAVSAYGGDLLPGFYEDWAQSERGRLEAVFEDRMAALLDRLVTERRWAEAQAWAERWIAQTAAPEAAYRALMISHAAQGDSARAAAAYRRCETALRTELGVEPAGATRDLYARLAKGEELPGLPAVISLPWLVAGEREAAGEPPFMGLRYFDTRDADRFFGREALTARLVARLAERDFLAVVGASGSGKSSVTRAGLLPALAAGALPRRPHPPRPDSREWRYFVVTPTGRPLRALALALTGDSESVRAAATLADDLLADERSLALFATRLATRGDRPATRDNPAARLCLLVDQFEEVFTLCRSDAERAAFIANLLAAAAPEEGDAALTAVLTLRADFYAHCAEFPALRAVLTANQEYIGAMSRDELRRAIECPADEGGWQFEPGLVDELLHDVGSEPGALPLLSHALLETWRRRRGRALTLAGYAASGRVAGAVAATAQTTYDGLSPEQQTAARGIFLRLTELGEGTQDTRRRAAIADLITDPATRPAVESALHALAAARLVTVAEDYAEVAHEALIREWPRLREWLTEDRDALRVHRQLGDAAHAWAALDRDAGELFRGARLARASEWAQTHGAEMNALELDFLTASRNLAEAEAREREAQRLRELHAAQELADQRHRSALQMRRAARLLAGALLLALILGGAALAFGARARDAAARAQEAARSAENERTLAFSRELAASATNESAEDPQLALPLALEAATGPLRAGLPVPVEAEAALHRALQTPQHRAVIASDTGVAVSPDAALAVSAAEDGTLKLWPAAQWTLDGQPTAAPARVLVGAPGYRILAFSRDHRLLADATEDGSIAVWDTQTGLRQATLWQGRGPTGRLAFSDDGEMLASLDATGTARVWRVATGREVMRAGASGAPVLAMDLAPDGRRLVTGDETGAVTLWNAENGEPVWALPSQTDTIQEVRFCGGDRVAVRLPTSLTTWSAETGRPARRVEGLWRVFVGAFACDPLGDRIAVAGMGPEIKVIDIENGRELAKLPDTPAVASLEFSRDGLLLLARTPLETAEVWETYAGGDLAVMAAPEGTGAVAISPDGRFVAAGIDRTGGLALWKVEAAQGQAGTHPGSAAALVRIWPKLHPDAISALAFNADGRWLAAGDARSKVEVWDVRSLIDGPNPTPAFTLPPSPYWSDYRVQQLAFSPDGAFLAGVTPLVLPPYKPLTLWQLPRDASAGRPSALRIDDGTLPQWILSVTFSPDSQLIALGQRNGELQVRDALDGKLRSAFGGRDWGVEDLAYSPDGARLATVTQEGAYSIWAAQEAAEGAAGRELLTVREQDASYTAVAFTSGGERLITGSLDGFVRLRDAASGAELVALAKSGSPVSGLSLSADGRRLAVASDAIRVLLLDTNDLIAAAQHRVTRALTSDERARYLREASAATTPPSSLKTGATSPRRPEQIVRAFVNSWNRMDAYAVSSLFGPKFSYSLDAAFGRGEYPLPSRNALATVVVFMAQGERGRYTLEGCAAPAADGTVACRLTYTSACIKALGNPPLRIPATFAFDGTKISMVTGEPSFEDQRYVPDEYRQFMWSFEGAPALWKRLNEMDQTQGLSIELSQEAGQIWRELCQRYAQR